MAQDPHDWVDSKEEEIKKERAKEYFNIVEGANRFVLLSHCAPLSQVYEGGKYRPAVEGDAQSKISIKGLCWVYQEGAVKSAKLPYTVVKMIRSLQANPDWEFKLPFPHVLTLNAKNAGTKEVEYSLTPSPKEVEIPKDILDILAKKPKPEELVERIKSGKKAEPRDSQEPAADNYPTEDIDPADMPF